LRGARRLPGQLACRGGAALPRGRRLGVAAIRDRTPLAGGGVLYLLEIFDERALRSA
jgi:hypothetical protein